MSIVSLSVEDPSSHEGMIKISEKLIPYLPRLPSAKKQKTVLFGDQLYIERGKSVHSATLKSPAVTAIIITGIKKKKKLWYKL